MYDEDIIQLKETIKKKNKVIKQLRSTIRNTSIKLRKYKDINKRLYGNELGLLKKKLKNGNVLKYKQFNNVFNVVNNVIGEMTQNVNEFNVKYDERQYKDNEYYKETQCMHGSYIFFYNILYIIDGYTLLIY